MTMNFKISDIVKATGGKLACGSASTICVGLNIDSRKAAKGELFVAIKGAHFDGHEFLEEVKKLGVNAALVESGKNYPKDIATVEVPDTQKALGDIAAWWRSKFNIPRVAITGSNGKSTTKEMTAAVVLGLGNVLKTEGNFNNLIGLPLTVFRMDSSCRVAILEMGMNAPGEISRLTQIASPTVGLITNITAAHLEKLHTVEAVACAKGELFDTMDKDAIAVVNGEDRFVREMGFKKKRRIVFGMQNDADVKFLHMEMTNLDSIGLNLSVMGKEYKVRLPVPGAHNVMNALAAISVGVALGIDTKSALERLENFHPMAMRLERVQLANGVRLVNDSYNANPESMKAALRTVGAAKRSGRFIAVLGDMLELGTQSASLHREVGEAAGQLGVTKLYVVGNFAADLADGAKNGGLDKSSIIICSDVNEIGANLEGEVASGDVILVKGSRGMKMERIVDHLKNQIGMG